MRVAVSLAVATLVAYGAPVGAQSSEDGIGATIETSVIPKPRIVRPPSLDDTDDGQDSDLTTGDSADQSTAQNTDQNTGAIEIQPLAAPTSQQDTTVAVQDQNAAGVQVQQGTVDGQSGDQTNTAGEIVTRPTVRVLTARSDEDDEAGGNRWQRARARRFKLAPKTPGTLDYSTVTAPIVPIESVETVLTGGARLRQLDKMTGQTTTFDMAVGEVRQVERLRLALDACRAPEDNDQHGTMAFLQIWDTKRLDDPPAFSGWMIAESPALSALDHPRYDVWLISCKIASAEASTASD